MRTSSTQINITPQPLTPPDSGTQPLRRALEMRVARGLVRQSDRPYQHSHQNSASSASTTWRRAGPLTRAPGEAGVAGTIHPVSLRQSTVASAADAPAVLDEHVVLVDARGRPAGTVATVFAHSVHTPLHRAFSCHVVGRNGQMLLTRRALSKRTWPRVWTNACCGHPQLGETLRDAVTRRLGEELGVIATRMSVVVPDFVYRAEMDDGTVEHELCPVVVAEIERDPRPDPAEVEAVEWCTWTELVDRAVRNPQTLSPWAVRQLDEMTADAWTPEGWTGGTAPTAGAADAWDRLLDDTGAPGNVPTSGPVAADHATLAETLSARLSALLATKSAQLVAVDVALADVVDEIGGLLTASGKRLRPAFVYWGHRATGADHDDAVVDVAAAVELLHTFALLHDDVMDGSVHRRGRLTAHRAFAARHRAAGWSGDAGRFGESAAVLAGDLVFVWADEMLRGASWPADALGRAGRVFDVMRNEVMAGQYLDLLQASDPASDESAARKVALLKSARYTVTRPLEIGAALADPGSASAVEPALRTYGDALGIAFQLRDDVLGLYGDPEATGKSDLDDLREGKRTLLVLRALRLATDSQAGVLREALGNPDLDVAQASRVCAIVAGTGALASVEALLVVKHLQAVHALAVVPEPARTALTQLADLAVWRRA